MSEKQSILVVDDKEFSRYSLVKVLESRGYEVLGVESGSEAIRIFSEKTFDLVLTNLMMNGTGGLEVAGHIKALSPNTMIIIMTEYASIKTAISALRLGVYDYVLKPFDEGELIIRIGRAFEMKRCIEEQEHFQEVLTIAKTTVSLADQINTPLNVLLSNIEMLQHFGESDLPKRKKALHIMENQIFKIEGVLERLTKFSAIETRKTSPGYEMLGLTRKRSNV
jgi:DNA-binding NtrC family response regulator